MCVRKILRPYKRLNPSRRGPTHYMPQFHPSKPHQVKQPLSKIAVNERAVSPESFILHHCGHQGH